MPKLWTRVMKRAELLKYLILDMYYGFKEWPANDDFERKLLKTPILGNYDPKGIVYAVQGSPPRGMVYVTDISLMFGSVYFFDHGKMKSMDSKKLVHNRNYFLNHAEKFLQNLQKE